MLRKTKSLLEELDGFCASRDRENVIESRGRHIIQSAINLINMMRESYDPETASDLERRLINSIKGQDSAKFTRGLKRACNEDK